MFLNWKNRGFNQVLFIIFLGSIFLFAHYYKEGRINLALFRSFKDPYCNIPIKISLGSIDERYKLSNEIISQELEKASGVWEEEAKKDLFVFDGKNSSTVIVNFVYDERQEETLASTRARVNLESGWNKYEEMVYNQKSLSLKYDNSQIIYNQAVKNYNARLSNFEQMVRNWNKKQGSEAEYRELKAEEERVDALYDNLEKQRISINNLAEQINSYNIEIKDLYSKLVNETNDYNRNFSSEDPITVGEYDGTYYINIYQFTDLAQLRITLAHELGHSLGMDHTENEKSIMYPLQSKQGGDLLTLSEEDKQELQKVCEAK